LHFVLHHLAPAPVGGLFGTPAPAPVGGLFGSTPAAMPQQIAPAPIAPTPSADVLLAQQLATVENQKRQLELTEAWRGNPPSGSKVIASSLYDNIDRGWDSYSTQSSALMSYRAPPRSAPKIIPRGFTPSKQSPITVQALKSGGSRSGVSPILSPNRFIGSATKSLIIKPGSLTPKPKTRLMLTNGITSETKDPSVANLENGRFESPRTLQYPTQDLQSPSPTAPKPVDSVSPRDGSPAMNDNASPAHDFYRQVVGSPNDADVPHASTSPGAINRHVPTLTKAGYTVYPPIHELTAMSEADLAAVSGFKVERPGYGSVEWDGAVDVRGVDLDSTVVIESKNVSVYDDAELNGSKPKQGSKLNRPAVITMHGVYPKSGPESTDDAKEKLSKKIEKSTKKMGAELISFNADTGVWSFRVGHFSRYGLDEDDSDDDSDSANATPSLATLEEDEKHELGGASKIHAPTNEDESTAGSAFADDNSAEQLQAGEDEEEMEILRDGDDAYAMMTDELVEYEDALELQPFEHEQLDEILFFPNEAEEADASEISDMQLTPSVTCKLPPSGSGICSKLANQCGLLQLSSSNIDYGLRMRRSFRVGKTHAA
jgi:nuclear pore complex protein Nup98-Nup96